MTTDVKKQAAIYCRISNDREGREWGVEDQALRCRERAESLGYEVVDVIVENDLSASTISKKPRPLYDQMMRRAEAGEFAAIISGSSSRLTRRPRESEDIIDRSIKYGLRIHYAKGPDPDFTTAGGRRRARDDASRDTEEAEETSERVKEAVRRRIRKGQWHGGNVPFGYRVIRSEEDGRLRKLEIEPSEAAIVQGIATSILEGKTLYRIAQDLKARGITTRRGKFFGPQVIRSMMLGGTIAGLRRHRERDLDGKVIVDEVHEGYCDAIVDRDSWNAIREILTDPGRDFAKNQRGGYGGKRALGGGVTICAVCKQRLVSAPNCRHRPDEDGRRPCDDDPDLRESEVRLVCKTSADGGCGKVGVNNQQLEAWVLDLLMERLSDRKFIAAVRKPIQRANDREAILRVELNKIGVRLDRVQEGFLAGILDAAKAKSETDRLKQERTELESELDGLRSSVSLAGIDGPDDARDLWGSASVLVRRQFLSALIEQIEVGEWPTDADGRKLPTTLTQRTDTRRGYEPETVEEFKARKSEYQREVLRKRVTINWRA